MSELARGNTTRCSPRPRGHGFVMPPAFGIDCSSLGRVRFGSGSLSHDRTGTTHPETKLMQLAWPKSIEAEQLVVLHRPVEELEEFRMRVRPAPFEGETFGVRHVVRPLSR